MQETPVVDDSLPIFNLLLLPTLLPTWNFAGRTIVHSTRPTSTAPDTYGFKIVGNLFWWASPILPSEPIFSSSAPSVFFSIPNSSFQWQLDDFLPLGICNNCISHGATISTWWICVTCQFLVPMVVSSACCWSFWVHKVAGSVPFYHLSAIEKLLPTQLLLCLKNLMVSGFVWWLYGHHHLTSHV